MNVYFAKSLDRPVDIFGIKGRWLTVFLICVGAAFVLSLILGFSFSTGVGISCMILCTVLSFLMCLMFQGRISHRQLDRAVASGKLSPYISKKETVGRILLSDPRRIDDKLKQQKR